MGSRAAVAFAFVFATTVPAAAATNRLYVSGPNDANYYSGYQAATTVSYTLADGRIGRRPDQTYPATTQGPVALDAAGNLYASQGDCGVTEYAADSTTVKRTLNVGFGPDGCIGYFAYQNIVSLAVDDRDDLYVGTAWEYDGSLQAQARAATRVDGSSSGCIYSCIYVYGPRATGSAAPLQTISIGDPGGGMTTDRGGDLYVHDSNGDDIIVIAHPVTRPKQVRSIAAQGFTNISHPIIDDGELYAMVRQCRDPGAACEHGVVALPAGASGVVQPVRSFVDREPASWTAFGIGGAGLYVLAGGSVIQAFDKHVQGETVPMFSQILGPLPVGPTFMAVGR